MITYNKTQLQELKQRHNEWLQDDIEQQEREMIRKLKSDMIRKQQEKIENGERIAPRDRLIKPETTFTWWHK